jgi:phage terminase small subunit
MAKVSIPQSSKINPQQERFCQEYLVDCQGTHAAIRAGYGKPGAHVTASRLLGMPKIQKRIAELQVELRDRTAISAEKVVAELVKLGFYSINDFLKDDNGIEKLKQMGRDKVAPVVGIKVTETFSGAGKRKRTNITTEVKLADKSRALELLGKHLGIFEKDNRQKSSMITIKRK